MFSGSSSTRPGWAISVALIERGAPIELRTPGRIADFTAVTFAVRQNLQIAQLAIRSDADGVRDEILAAHDFIDEDMPQQTTVARGPPDADGAMRGLRTRQIEERLELRRRLLRDDDFLERVGFAENGFLRLVDRHVVGRHHDGRVLEGGARVEDSGVEHPRGLQPGDIIADGGNSYWGDSIRRHARAKEHGIAFIDVGTSGGPGGARGGDLGA